MTLSANTKPAMSTLRQASIVRFVVLVSTVRPLYTKETPFVTRKLKVVMMLTSAQPTPFLVVTIQNVRTRLGTTGVRVLLFTRGMPMAKGARTFHVTELVSMPTTRARRVLDFLISALLARTTIPLEWRSTVTNQQMVAAGCSSYRTPILPMNTLH